MFHFSPGPGNILKLLYFNLFFTLPSHNVKRSGRVLYLLILSLVFLPIFPPLTQSQQPLFMVLVWTFSTTTLTRLVGKRLLKLLSHSLPFVPIAVLADQHPARCLGSSINSSRVGSLAQCAAAIKSQLILFFPPHHSQKLIGDYILRGPFKSIHLALHFEATVAFKLSNSVFPFFLWVPPSLLVSYSTLVDGF